MNGWMVDESCGYCWYRTEVVACATLCTTLTSRHFSALELILRCIISSGNGCERHYATFRLNPFCLNLTFFSVATLSPVVLPWQGQDKAWITEEVGMGSAGKSLWNVANGKQKKKDSSVFLPVGRWWVPTGMWDDCFWSSCYVFSWRRSERRHMNAETISISS